MHRRLVRRLRDITASGRSWVSPLVVGIGIWIGFPTGAAYQDMSSMIGGGDAGGARWAAFVERSVAGSIQAAEMPFTDATVTGSVMSGAGVTVPGIGAVSFRGKSGANTTPDEMRVMRADKMGRVVKVAPVTPPKAFNAGSVFKRTSLIQRAEEPELRMAFARSKVEGREVEIAAAFHVREDRPSDAGVPPILASLVTNDEADVLATAYAPAEPDYAKTSPFETLLGEDDPHQGRFIPPLAKGDHTWMNKPLPPEVFGKAEQKCLANAIYFEARSESLRGQAAVAQVVLNRVRNPAYPGSICGVVYQNDNWKNRCQFSFACDGIRDRVTDKGSYRVAEQVAMAVTAGKIFLPEVASSTHYYATYVSPRWARTMQRMKKIGLHIFYRTYGGGWS